MAGGKKGKAQKIILGEIKKQLILQAERWGRKNYYTPLKLEEIELEQCGRIKGELLSEKSNLEYELHVLGSDKGEVVAKVEKLGMYLKKADRVINAHKKLIEKLIQKNIGDRAQIQKAVSSINSGSSISVVVGEN